MWTLLLIASLFGYTALAVRVCRWPAGASLFFSVSLVIVSVYAAALAGLLPAGVWLLFVAGLVLFATAFVSRPGRASLGELLTPAPVLFSVIALLVSHRLRHEGYGNWDEFSHWGVVTKVLHGTGALPDADSAVMLKTYPPATALWQYFVTRIVGYSEGQVYVAQTLLLASAVLVLAGGRRQWISSIAAVVLGYLTLSAFGNELRSLLVDQVLGILFGAAIVMYFTSRRDAASLLQLIPPLFCLVLVKESGILFASIVVVIVLTHQAARVEWHHIRSVLDRRAVLRSGGTLAAIVLLVLTPALARGSWWAYVRGRGFVGDPVTGVTLAQARGFLSADRAQRAGVISENFRAALRTATVGNAQAGQSLNALMFRAGIARERSIETMRLEDQTWESGANTVVTRGGSSLRLGSREAAGSIVARCRVATVPGERYALLVEYRLSAVQTLTVRVTNAESGEATSIGSGTAAALTTMFRAGEEESVIEIAGVTTSVSGVADIDRVELTGAAADPAAGWKLPPIPVQPVTVHILGVALAAAFAGVWWLMPSREDRRLWIVVAGWLTAGACAYLFTLLLLYVYRFSEYEGVRLTSYARYVGTYFLACTIVLAGVVLHAQRTAGVRPRFAQAAGLLLLLLLLYVTPLEAIEWPFDRPRRPAVRRAVAEIARQVSHDVPPDKSVYIIWQNSNGLELYMMRYELAPRRGSVIWFSVGAPYSAGDVWTEPLTLESFAAQCRQYDYVLVASGDEQLWRTYGAVFAPDAHGRRTVLLKGRGTPPGVPLPVVRLIS